MSNVIFWITIGCVVCTFAFIVPYTISSEEYTGKVFKRRFRKKINLIRSAMKHQKTATFRVENKGRAFELAFKDVKPVDGIQYSTIPKYSYMDIYLNENIVCRVHELEVGIYKKAYAIEPHEKIIFLEVSELIDIAYKKAKRVEKQYWKDSVSKRSENSLYYKEN